MFTEPIWIVKKLFALNHDIMGNNHLTPIVAITIVGAITWKGVTLVRLDVDLLLGAIFSFIVIVITW